MLNIYSTCTEWNKVTDFYTCALLFYVIELYHFNYNLMVAIQQALQYASSTCFILRRCSVDKQRWKNEITN